MKKFCLLLSICILSSLFVSSQTPPSGDGGGLSASKVFSELPLEILDLIRPSTRLDMLDYYNQLDSLVNVQNALAGESRLEQVTQDYLKVSVTPISTLEIKLLPLKNDTIIMTLFTVSSDTDVRFFNSSMNPLPTEKFLKALTLKDFFNLKGSSITDKELNEKIPFETIVYATGPGETPLTATFTTLSALSQEDRDLLSPLLIPFLSSPWTNKFKFP